MRACRIGRGGAPGLSHRPRRGNKALLGGIARPEQAADVAAWTAGTRAESPSRNPSRKALARKRRSCRLTGH